MHLYFVNEGNRIISEFENQKTQVLILTIMSQNKFCICLHHAGLMFNVLAKCSSFSVMGCGFEVRRLG